MPSSADIHCRVCGLAQPEPPWGDDGTTPSFDICDCCGVEFGYEDTTREAASRYRAEWLTKGAHWFEPDSRPDNWDVNEQLKSIPADFG
jgi:hypothetical protein